MILVMTENADLDTTYQVDELTFGVAHCVEEAHAQTGSQGGSRGLVRRPCLRAASSSDAAQTQRVSRSGFEWRRAPVASPGSLSAGPSGPRHWAISSLGGSTTRGRSRGLRLATRLSPRASAAPPNVSCRSHAISNE